MADEDRVYTDWLRKQACCNCGTDQDVQVHHHTNGSTAPLFPIEDEPLGSLEAPRGRGQRAHDHWGMPLCLRCHHDLHALAGSFRKMTGRQRREWQDGQVRILRMCYLDKETF